MKKSFTKFMLMLCCCLFGVANGWAQGTTTIYSQNFDDESSIPAGWTQANGTLTLETDGTNKYLKETSVGSGSRGAWYTGTAIKDAVNGKANWTIEFDCLIAEGTNTTNYSQGVWILGSDLSQSWGAPSKCIAGFSKGSNAKTYTLSVNSAATATTVNLTSNTWYHYIFAYDKTTNKLTISVKSQGNATDVMAATEFDYDYQTSGIGDLNSIQFQAGRGTNATSGFTCLDNIVITYDESSVPTEIGYTVKYMCGETELKTVEGIGYTGSAPSIDTTPIYANGNKYIYVSDNVATVGNLTETAEENVYKAMFREAAVYNFSVNAKDGEGTLLATILNASTFEGDSYTYGYPQYILSGTTLHNIAAGSGDWYQKSIAPAEDGVVENLVYNNGTVSNVVFYTEGENIPGVSGANNGQRASNGRMGHTGNLETYRDVTTLAPGVYQIYWRGVNGNSATRTCNFKIGEGVVYSCEIPNGTNVTGHSENITVSENSTLSFACGGSSASGLDWMYIVKAADVLPINSYGWSSYAPSMNVTVPAGAEVYYVSAQDGKTATLAKVEAGATVAANTGLLVKSEGATVTFAASSVAPTAINDNLLLGTQEPMEVAAASVYVLGNTATYGVGLYKYSGTTLAAGKAYMPVPAGQAPARFVFATGETTGIEAVEGAEAVKANGVYNLNGQKVSADFRGIVIKNGKKVIK